MPGRVASRTSVKSIIIRVSGLSHNKRSVEAYRKNNFMEKGNSQVAGEDTCTLAANCVLSGNKGLFDFLLACVITNYRKQIISTTRCYLCGTIPRLLP